MAKAKKIGAANPWDLPQAELGKASKEITEVTKGAAKATPPPTKRKAKASKKIEPLAVIRVGKSFHKKAKMAALNNDLTLQEYIEELINKYAK